MSTDTTLADVQPGGRVRLGDQAELDRLEFQAWARELLPCPFCGNSAEFVPYKDNGLTLKCKSMGCIQRNQRTLRYGIDWLRTSMAEHWNTRALSAQPSPGGQDGLVQEALEYFERAGDAGDRQYVAAIRAALAARQPVGEPVAWQSMATCPRDGTAVLLRWGEDHVSPGWWCAAVSPIQNEDGTWPRETGGFPWAFFDMNDGVAFVNHAVDTEYGPTHWAPYVYPAAQAVDLGRFREAVTQWKLSAERVIRCKGHAMAEDKVKVRDEAVRLLALIESQAVGK